LGHSNEDKPRGRPQAPDVCASLRQSLAPDHNLTPLTDVDHAAGTHARANTGRNRARMTPPAKTHHTGADPRPRHQPATSTAPRKSCRAALDFLRSSRAAVSRLRVQQRAPQAGWAEHVVDQARGRPVMRADKVSPASCVIVQRGGNWALHRMTCEPTPRPAATASRVGYRPVGRRRPTRRRQQRCSRACGEPGPRRPQ
jgi:hypothetical protein